MTTTSVVHVFRCLILVVNMVVFMYVRVSVIRQVLRMVVNFIVLFMIMYLLLIEQWTVVCTVILCDRQSRDHT